MVKFGQPTTIIEVYAAIHNATRRKRSVSTIFNNVLAKLKDKIMLIGDFNSQVRNDISGHF